MAVRVCSQTLQLADWLVFRAPITVLWGNVAGSAALRLELEIDALMPFGTRAWKLCAQPNCREERASDATDPLRIRVWLLGFKSDPLKIAGLRLILRRELGRDVSRMSNDDVVDSIVALIARGTVHVHAEPVEWLPVMSVVKPAPPPTASAKPPAPSAKLPAINAPTFPANVNLLSQATTLVAAAAEGAPFCPL